MYVTIVGVRVNEADDDDEHSETQSLIHIDDDDDETSKNGNLERMLARMDTSATAASFTARLSIASRTPHKPNGKLDISAGTKIQSIIFRLYY